MIPSSNWILIKATKFPRIEFIMINYRTTNTTTFTSKVKVNPQSILHTLLIPIRENSTITPASLKILIKLRKNKRETKKMWTKISSKHLEIIFKMSRIGNQSRNAVVSRRSRSKNLLRNSLQWKRNWKITITTSFKVFWPPPPSTEKFSGISSLNPSSSG